jgi:hypothetical protein
MGTGGGSPDHPLFATYSLTPDVGRTMLLLHAPESLGLTAVRRAD